MYSIQPERARRWLLFGSLVLLVALGCKRNAPPPTGPQTSAGPAAAEALLAPESAEWTAAEACTHLEDAKLGLSAAVRLVRLAAVEPLCLPADAPDALLGKLRLVRLNDEYWALGIAQGRQADALYAPVLISTTGEVQRVAEDIEEELATLHIAADPEVFPHVVIRPQRVQIIDDYGLSTAVVLNPDQRVRFTLRRHEGFPYVALVVLDRADDDEAARYTWGPYELVFLGPAQDRLPIAGDEYFAIDVQASERWEPLGGELPETKPVQPMPSPDEPQRRPLDIAPV